MKFFKIILFTVCTAIANSESLEDTSESLLTTTTEISKLRAAKTKTEFVPFEPHNAPKEGFSKLKQMRPGILQYKQTPTSLEASIYKMSASNKESLKRKKTSTETPPTSTPALEAESAQQPESKQAPSKHQEKTEFHNELRTSLNEKTVAKTKSSIGSNTDTSSNVNTHYHVHYIHYPGMESPKTHSSRYKSYTSDLGRQPKLMNKKANNSKLVKQFIQHSKKKKFHSRANKQNLMLVKPHKKHFHKNSRHQQIRSKIKSNRKPRPSRRMFGFETKILNTTQDDLNVTSPNQNLDECASTTPFNLTSFHVQYLKIIPEDNPTASVTPEFAVIPIKNEEYLRVWNRSPVVSQSKKRRHKQTLKRKRLQHIKNVLN
ncbi:uncharacterized protein LOC123293727 [Chrysoperla carnea]|uniref:uncharacterized protein LOC123293727 n=1 Tax=Chrysoperla carnea TaxID=189513 RepID=UPI001D061AF0|nr:uncharacterized protein LOC123293727 [Chrysoperla carnea]